MTRRNATLLVLLILIIALTLIKLYVQEDLAGLGTEYAALTTQASLLQDTNIHMQGEVLQAQSLMTIEQQARARGFVEGRIEKLSK